MNVFYFWVGVVVVTMLSCSQEGNKSETEQTKRTPLYGNEVLIRKQPSSEVLNLAYYVPADTIKKHGVQSVLLALAKQDCDAPCAVNLWDNKEAQSLNEEIPYSQRTASWQKRHFVFIADHNVAFKDFGSDEVIKYPFTYDANYKRWGGKLKH